ncbi:MAG TPA: hypothetical protein VFS80_05885 [Burkholderiales bacterium]|nr:hypothetical protein [Burkholderiales bacterium]
MFLFLAAAALSVILLRPVCEAAFGHAVLAQHPAACCENVEDGTAPDLVDLTTPGPGGKPLLGGVADLLGASFSPLPAATRFASPVLPARSYYTRSSRIQR